MANVAAVKSEMTLAGVENIVQWRKLFSCNVKAMSHNENGSAWLALMAVA